MRCARPTRSWDSRELMNRTVVFCCGQGSAVASAEANLGGLNQRNSGRETQTMNVIPVYRPERTAHEVLFRWKIDPSSALYHAPQFTLRFPVNLDLRDSRSADD